MTLQSSQISVNASPGAMQDYFESQGWTDGLPVVPPTPGLVETMVAGSGLLPSHEVAPIAPSLAIATVEKVAINAVMAGCRPEYMPVVITALRALSRQAFNLAGIQATTHPVAPLILVNGPIRRRIGLNCGTNIFGQGFRPNATIGRAVRLVLMNIGQAIPGVSDMATHGTPCKFGFCGGENEEDSPWEPYHVEYGMKADDSTVLVHAAEAPHNVMDHASIRADELLLTTAEVMMSMGANNLSSGGEMVLVFSPEHAGILARHGMSKQDVRIELFQRLRLDLARIGSGQLAWFKTKRKMFFNITSDMTEIPYLDDPDQIRIAVAGGPGLHSLVIPSFGISHCVLERIEESVLAPPPRT